MDREHDKEVDAGDDKVAKYHGGCHMQERMEEAWGCRQPSRGSTASFDDGFVRPSRDVDVATTDVPLLSLLES
jgi:hypothetical protein